MRNKCQRSRLMYVGIHIVPIWRKAGMNPKALQYLMGHSDIGVTLNVYTHLGLIDAKEEMNRIAKLA